MTRDLSLRLTPLALLCLTLALATTSQAGDPMPPEEALADAFPERETFSSDEEAESLLDRPRRSGYQLPDLG